ncbi:MAG: AarF/UbiB family protein [Candidatus Azotimanducaceae bacterium]
MILFPIKLIPCNEPLSVSFRKALEDLGPIFVKTGQILSTRKDLFDLETLKELEKLQDKVAPFDTSLAIKIIEKELDASLEQTFTSFNKTPLASASVAQIYEAKLVHGNEKSKDVVLKVIRPNIEKTIKKDVGLMKWLAKILTSLIPDSKRLHLETVIEDYERTLLNELDLRIELANTKSLREKWEHSGKLYVPEVYEDLSSERLMIMERVGGLPVNSIASFKENDVDLRKLAHLGVEIFFTQVFEHNFFHADMHPGNVFVDITNPERPTYIALDCAVVGSLNEKDRLYLAKNIYSFFHRDYIEIARLHHQSGWIPKETDVEEFARVIRNVVDPYFNKPINEISLSNVLINLFHLAKTHKVEIQPQLILLQKNLLNIEGMGRQVYPELNLWETAAPFIENWVKDRIGAASIAKRLKKKFPIWMETLPELPEQVAKSISEIKNIQNQQMEQTRQLKKLTKIMEKRERDKSLILLSLVTLVGSSFFYWIYINL